MILLLAGTLLLAAPQQDGTRVSQLLAKLVANNRQYEAALPSLTCEETVHSQRLKKGKVKEEVVLDATMRVVRTGDAREPFDEKHVFHTRNGKPLPEGVQYPRVPFFVSGAFANALGFGRLAAEACLEVALQDDGTGPTLQLTVERKAELEPNPACAAVKTTKVLTVDREDAQVVHLLRTMSPEQAEQYRDVPYAELDYAPVALGDKTFWLPSRAEMHSSDEERRVIVTYTGCRRFAATVTITGGTQTVPDPQ